MAGEQKGGENCSSTNKKKADAPPLVYLHMGPSGDCWTGHSIFAAKHLQPDYVRSVALPTPLLVHKNGNKDTDDAAQQQQQEEERMLEALLETIESDPSLQRQIYDEERIPESLLEQVKAMLDEERE